MCPVGMVVRGPRHRCLPGGCSRLHGFGEASVRELVLALFHRRPCLGLRETIGIKWVLDRRPESAYGLAELLRGLADVASVQQDHPFREIDTLADVRGD